MFTKRVAVAQKSKQTNEFGTIVQDTAHGDVHFGQKPYFITSYEQKYIKVLDFCLACFSYCGVTKKCDIFIKS